MTTECCRSLSCEQEASTAKARRPPAASGPYLCSACKEKLAEELAGLPGLYEDCEQVLISPRARRLERISGRRAGDIHLDEAAVGARSTIVSVLASWCGLVAEERGLDAPRGREVPRLAAYLDQHLDWLAEHPAVAEFAQEVENAVRAARDAAGTGPAMRVEAGACMTPGCEQPVYAVLHPADRSLPYQVACEAGHPVEPRQWLLLGQRRFRSHSA